VVCVCRVCWLVNLYSNSSEKVMCGLYGPLYAVAGDAN